jgi:quercetin 2,3-dioxygenase
MSDKKTISNAIRNSFALEFLWQTSDPFLFCAYHKDKFPKGNDDLGPVSGIEDRQIGSDFVVKDGYRMYHGEKVPGFPGHPHRGFETVTIVREGAVDHADSLGAAGRYGAGDVQWMTAGKGIQHSEMFPLLSDENENPLELFQVWLNLPKANKFAEPHFKMLWNGERSQVKGDGYSVDVVAGNFEDKTGPTPPPDSWANNPENSVAIWVLNIDSNKKMTLPKAVAGLNRTLYFYQGDQLKLGDTGTVVNKGFELDSALELTVENTGKPAQLLLLQGKPIDEPVVKHGPFVMNTREEIVQAITDYQRDQYGGWPWDTGEVVHDKSKDRFALHPDGQIETPEKN